MLKNMNNSNMKILYKRINYKLLDSFFTLQEFLILPHRKQIKIIKYISKYEDIYLDKKEIREVIHFIKNGFDIEKSKSITKL